MVPNTEVVVGDVMFLDTGDKIIADGIVIDAQVCVATEARCCSRAAWTMRAQEANGGGPAHFPVSGKRSCITTATPACIPNNSQGLIIDEASLTGESDPIKKDADTDPWVRSGTTVNEGSGHMLVAAVGSNSEWGKTMALVSEAGDDETPLQVSDGINRSSRPESSCVVRW